jgi:hypothetical protein
MGEKQMGAFSSQFFDSNHNWGTKYELIFVTFQNLKFHEISFGNSHNTNISEAI